MYRMVLISWLVLVLVGSFLLADEQVNWVGGTGWSPGYCWEINPIWIPFDPPPPEGVTTFCGPTEVFSNSCFAEMGYGGTPTLTLDPYQKIVELWFEPPAPTACPTYYDPVCGLQGWFGPLDGGEWVFWAPDIQDCFPIPYPYVYLEFYVDAPLATVTLQTPNGGENLYAGNSYTISWSDSRATGSCGGEYLLYYSTDDGQKWTAITTNPVSAACSYEWLIPVEDADQCLVRLVDYYDDNISDVSDHIFSIHPCLEPVVCDLDRDCFLTLKDFSCFANHWLAYDCSQLNQWCEGTDFDHSETVVLPDLTCLVQYWP